MGGMRHLAFLVLVALAAPALRADPTGTIEGQITLLDPQAPAPEPGVSPYVTTLVFANGFPAGMTFPPPSKEAEMKQSHKRFVPYILPIQVGTTVRFPNEDDFFHNVFSATKSNPFNIGRYPHGPGKTQVFAKVGHVKVFCDIHSFMKGHIVVLPSPHFVTPDAKGHYRLDGVPVGSYWVSTWHDRLAKPEQKPVTVKAGETAKVDLTVQ